MRIKAIGISEALSLSSFYKNMPIAAIEKAIAAGSKVELEESTFNDSNDYVKVLIDGVSIFYVEGY